MKNFNSINQKDARNELPYQVQIFLDHLETGLECFDKDFMDYAPFTMQHDEYGNGLLFSQLSKHESCPHEAAQDCLIVSNEGIHVKGEKILFFSNEQPPTKLAFLVLSAIIKKEPLRCECPQCDT